MKRQAMHHHRFANQFSAQAEVERPAPLSPGFVACPLALQQGPQAGGCPWQQVYQWAYAQAEAAARPSLLERFQATNWN
jgi:hypothetical protein